MAGLDICEGFYFPSDSCKEQKPWKVLQSGDCVKIWSPKSKDQDSLNDSNCFCLPTLIQNYQTLLKLLSLLTDPGLSHGTPVNSKPCCQPGTLSCDLLLGGILLSFGILGGCGDFIWLGLSLFFSCRRRKVTDKWPQELILAFKTRIISWEIV